MQSNFRIGMEHANNYKHDSNERRASTITKLLSEPAHRTRGGGVIWGGRDEKAGQQQEDSSKRWPALLICGERMDRDEDATFPLPGKTRLLFSARLIRHQASWQFGQRLRCLFGLVCLVWCGDGQNLQFPPMMGSPRYEHYGPLL